MTRHERDLLEKAAVVIGFLMAHPNLREVFPGTAMHRRAREFLDGYEDLKGAAKMGSTE